MKEPVWLREALKGHPLRLNNGYKAYIRYKENVVDVDKPLYGVVICDDGENTITSWTINGKWLSENIDSRFDISGLHQEDEPKFNYWWVLSDDIIAIAKDEDGYWFGYKTVPSIGEEEWNCDTFDSIELLGLSDNLLPECRWTNSLIKRPDKD